MKTQKKPNLSFIERRVIRIINKEISELKEWMKIVPPTMSKREWNKESRKTIEELRAIKKIIEQGVLGEIGDFE